jgi:hypothetical protein
MKHVLSSMSNNRSRRAASGFTLVEAMIGMFVLALFVLTCFGGVVFNRTASLKAKEEAIAMDFLVHYAETLKGMSFSSVVPGQPINPIFNGVGGAPNIVLPANSSWVSVNTPDFETFHPDLFWLQNLNPKMQVTLSTSTLGGIPHETHINVMLAWDSPMGHGGRITSQIDLLRVSSL